MPHDERRVGKGVILCNYALQYKVFPFGETGWGIMPGAFPLCQGCEEGC